jgi:hypothetical protein
MIKVIDMLGFKVNKFNEWLRKSGKAQIDTRVKSASETSVPALLKAPRFKQVATASTDCEVIILTYQGKNF